MAAAGGLCAVTGLVPLPEVAAVTTRLAPILVFLVAVTVVAELADGAEVFDVAAVEAARLAGGSTFWLFGLVLVLGTCTTVLLSLDTTAVLLTPVVLSLALHLGLPTRPFAMAAVWLANTASLLLPVSNLTNLLAADRLDLDAAEFARHMWLPAVAAVLTTWLLLFVRYRRQLRGRYQVPARRRAADRPLFWLGAAVCVAIGPACVAGTPVWLAAGVAAAVLVTGYAVRRPRALAWSLVPWRMVLLVEGLFLVVAAAERLGLRAVLGWLLGPPDGPFGMLRTAVVTAGAANLVNNLPAYSALEGAGPADSWHVLPTLVGANLGPLVLLWGSLATLLWRERCRSRGVAVPAGHFAAVGLVGVPLLLLVTVTALWLNAA